MGRSSDLCSNFGEGVASFRASDADIGPGILESADPLALSSGQDIRSTLSSRFNLSLHNVLHKNSVPQLLRRRSTSSHQQEEIQRLRYRQQHQPHVLAFT
jgi:hypothetical protein